MNGLITAATVDNTANTVINQVCKEVSGNLSREAQHSYDL